MKVLTNLGWLNSANAFGAFQFAAESAPEPNLVFNRIAAGTPGYTPWLNRLIISRENVEWYETYADDGTLIERVVVEPTRRFAAMVETHDLTYQYSDDGMVYRAGELSYQRLYSYAQAHLTTHEANIIWNARVKRALQEPYCKGYMWLFK